MIRARWRFAAVAGCVLTFAARRPVVLSARKAPSRARSRATRNHPIADARVIVIGGQASATTGEDGKYTLRNVPAERPDVQALKVGYRAFKKSVTVASGVERRGRLRDDAGGRAAPGDRHDGDR